LNLLGLFGITDKNNKEDQLFEEQIKVTGKLLGGVIVGNKFKVDRIYGSFVPTIYLKNDDIYAFINELILIKDELIKEDNDQ
jgi:hypothetical protein